MHRIVPARPEDAAAIHAIQMRAFAEEGRLSDSTQIPPLVEDVAAIELHIRTQTVLTARDGERIIGSARAASAREASARYAASASSRRARAEASAQISFAQSKRRMRALGVSC